MPDLSPVPAFAASALTTGALLLRRQLKLPGAHVGARLLFEDGTASRVYRETLLTGEPCEEPALLVVRFKLKWIERNPILHALFRAESMLNTPLFAGFDGFRSKLWCTDESTGVYRGVYQWDGAHRARNYADTLLKLLALVSVPGSLAYHVVPGTVRDVFLADPKGVAGPANDPSDAWWRLKEPAVQWSTS